MARKATKKISKPSAAPKDTFGFKKTGDKFGIVDPKVHVYGKRRKVCATNQRGYATPDNRSPLEIVVDASNGFIPLWGPNVTLHWRFNEASMQVFQNPELAKNGIRELLGEAILQWGDGVPVGFTESSDVWDFEFVMRSADNCDANGCTLARAFFPDAGQHDLLLFPILFQQSEEERLETFVHELGHVFGLRHFFANVDETAFPSEIFGTHDKFSIMNYGDESVLTEADKTDLAALYDQVWSGALTEINQTPIVQFRPFHEANSPSAMLAGGAEAVNSKCTSAATEQAMRELLVQLLQQS